MQYPHLLQCTATRWRFRFNKKGKAYAGWYKYFYATLWVSLECSKPDVVQARPGQARPGQGRKGLARPGHAKAAACKQSDNRWHFGRALGSACCVYLTVRVSICMHTHTRMYMCAHGPLYCQAAVQSLIMLMDIRFDLAELTRHMLPLLLLLSSPSFFLFLFFSCRAKPH